LEEVHHTRIFKGLIDYKRCVAVVNGFYEWDRNLSDDQPYYFTNEDESKPVFLACLYNNVPDEEEKQHINEFVILTMKSEGEP
jgi:putative SOS response-associated peptidase YedK